jgi:hypothetical protein
MWCLMSGGDNQRLAAPAADDRPQAVQPGSDIALSAAAGGPVVVGADQLVRRILLRDNTIRVVMGIFVACALPSAEAPE